MSDQTAQPTGPTIIPTEGFPPLNLPTLLADGVSNIAPSAQIVKFYFYRTDPNTGDAALYKNQVFLQIAMATDSFANTCIFFERALKHLVATNLISQERVNQINSVFDAAAGQ